MRNLKRALSLALASVMLLGLMVVSAGAADPKDFSDYDEIQNVEAVQTLVALNVINGKDDGSYDPTGIVTRAEMAKLITIALNGGKDPVLGTKAIPSYTDIKGNWAEAYIEYCTSLNIISGRGDGKFDPSGTVTGNEAAKMMLVAMGWDATIFNFTGAAWAINVGIEANKVDLFDGLESINPGDGLSRDNAAQLIYNGILAKTMSKDPSMTITNGEVTWNYALSSDTIFSTKFGGKVFIGTFDGNYQTGNTVRDGEIQVYGKLEDAEEKDPDKHASFPDDLTISNIGEEVKVLFKDGTGGTAGQPDKKDTIYGVFNTGNTTVYNITKNDMQNCTTTGKIKFGGTEYKVAAIDEGTAAIVYNYGLDTKDGADIHGAAADATAAEFAAYITNTANGLRVQSGDTIKFVADSDGVIYRAYVVESSLAKVTSATSTKLTLSGVGAIDIEDNDVEEDLKSGDIVVYTKLYKADKDDATFVVKTAETIEGEVTGYTATEKVAIEGTTYKIAEKALMANLTDDSMTSLVGEVDTNVIAYFVNGMVAAIDKNDTTASSYALVIGSNDADTNDNKMTEGKVKLLLSDGTKNTYVVDEDSKVQLNTDNVKAGQLVKYSLNSDSAIEISKVVSDKANAAIWNADTKIVGGKAVAASDAVLYLSTSASGDYKVYNVRSLKSISNAIDVYYATNSAGKITVAFADLKAVPSGATSDTKYGMVTANNGVVKIDDVYYSQFLVWTGEETTVNVKGQTSTLATGDYVVFDESNDTTYGSSDVKVLADVAGTRTVTDVAVKEYSTSDEVLSYYTKLLKDVDGTTYSGDKNTLKTAAMDDDAVIIYVNRNDKKAGDDIGVNPFDTSTGYANVKMVTDKDGVIVALLVETSTKCDINGAKTVLGGEQLFSVAAPTMGATTGTASADYPAGDFSVTASAAEGVDKAVITFTVTYNGSKADTNDTFVVSCAAASGAGACTPSEAVTGIAKGDTFTCSMAIAGANIAAPVITVEATEVA